MAISGPDRWMSASPGRRVVTLLPLVVIVDLLVVLALGLLPLDSIAGLRCEAVLRGGGPDPDVTVAAPIEARKDVLCSDASSGRTTAMVIVGLLVLLLGTGAVLAPADRLERALSRRDEDEDDEGRGWQGAAAPAPSVQDAYLATEVRAAAESREQARQRDAEERRAARVAKARAARLEARAQPLALPAGKAKKAGKAARPATKAKKAAAKKVVSKKVVSKKGAAKKGAAKKVVARKGVAKEGAAKEVVPKEVAAKKVAAKKAGSRKVVAGGSRRSSRAAVIGGEAPLEGGELPSDAPTAEVPATLEPGNVAVPNGTTEDLAEPDSPVADAGTTTDSGWEAPVGTDDPVVEAPPAAEAAPPVARARQVAKVRRTGTARRTRAAPPAEEADADGPDLTSP